METLNPYKWSLGRPKTPSDSNGAHHLSVDICEAESVMVCGECGDV